MKGKYINTTIILAAMSGRKTRKSAPVKETLAATSDHKIIWSKATQPTKISAVAYRSVSALIH